MNHTPNNPKKTNGDTDAQLELQIIQAKIHTALSREDSASRSRSTEAKEVLTRANPSLHVDHADSNHSDCVDDKNTTDFADDEMDDDLSDYKTHNKGYESLSQIDRRATTLLNDDYVKHKWLKLFRRSAFWMRLLTLFLSIILLTLSIAYCIAQLLNVELDLVSECEPMSPSDIWAYSASLSPQQGELTKEAQYGWHNAACKTTKKMQFNTDNIWYKNHYKYHWIDTMNSQGVLFGLLSLYCLIISIYTITTLILDIIHVKHNRLYTKSKQFVHYTNNKAQNVSKKKEKRVHAIWKKCKDTYTLYCGADTTSWIVRTLINEIIEIVIQFNALLLYNGYNVSDTTHSKAVYTAAKPEYIILFATFIALNCFGSGIVWLSYGVAPKLCHGLLFKLSLFFVDQFSDLFYAVFPFIVIFDDDYNDGSSLWVSFGQLNIDSPLKFIAAFFPLFLLCNKCLQITINSRTTLRTQYYNEWKVVRDLCRQNDNALAAYQARLQGAQVNSDTLDQTQELYDENGKLKISISPDPKDNTAISTKRNVIISVTALCYIIYGIVLLVLVTQYLTQSEAHCNLVKESNYFGVVNGSVVMDNVTLSDEEMRLLQQNPELFMYDACLYKMYPFTKDERTKCQCKVLVIDDWAELKSDQTQRSIFNVTQQRILTGMLQNWFMLEKFRTEGLEGDRTEVEITMDASLYQARNMKAFEWIRCDMIVNQEGMSNWNQLEYLKFDHVTNLQFSSNDIGQLKQLKQLSLISTGLREFPQQICNMTRLDVLQFWWNFITSVPHCIQNLKHLEQLTIDGAASLVDIPLSMFSLPNLYILSLFKASITYVDLVSYNLDGIAINDTQQINEWMDANFKWNRNTTYWLQRNPICDEDVSEMHSGFAEFMMSNATSCHYECSDYHGEPVFATDNCIPYLLGDGKCDEYCNTPYCAYDKGDCVQLCFAQNVDYTNCTWEKYTNDKCDTGCDNQYCAGFIMDSNFGSLTSFFFGPTSDLEHCENGEWEQKYYVVSDDMNHDACRSSQSIYIEWDNEKQHKQCEEDEWLGDGLCDDACRTEECNYDDSDCERGCQDEGDVCLTIYSIWTGFLGTTQYKFGHDHMCSAVWPIVAAYFELPQNMSCQVELINTDYNHDGMTNFREFVVIGMQLVMNSPKWKERPTQVNCSSCIGVENYNI